MKQTNVVRRREVAWYGYRRDSLDNRDRLFTPHAHFRTHLPAAVDLRHMCPPVMDQGALGSCTAHGITGALRFARIKAGTADLPLSRLQLYYDERSVERTIDSDAGAEIRDGIKCAVKLGVGPETDWPYVISRFKRKPPTKCYQDALRDRALVYERVPVDDNAIKAAIASGFPVIIGISVYDGFESAATAATGIVPMPNFNEGPIGGHCMYVVGYGQKPGYFTVRNSWGKWADHGDCYLPEAYLGSTRYGSDYWVIRKAGAA